MSRDLRSSFRFALPEGQDRAILRVGWRKFRVRVLNASATGFMLACPPLEIIKGEALWLRTAAAWTEVRVVFVEHAEEETRLGVERIRELEEALPETSAWSPFGGPESGGIVANVGNLAVALGVLAAIVVGAVFLHQEWKRSSGAHSTSSFSRSLASFERDVQRACSDTAAAIKRMLPRMSFSARSGEPASRASERLVSDVTAKLPDLVPTSMPSSPSDLAASLGLDESPQRQLEKILSSAGGDANQRLTVGPTEISRNVPTHRPSAGTAPASRPAAGVNSTRAGR